MSSAYDKQQEPRPRKAADGWQLAVAGVALIAAGCIPAPGADNALFVVLPYAAALVATAFSALAFFGISLRRPKPGDERPNVATRLGGRLLVAMIASVMACIGELLYLLFVGWQGGFGYVAPGVAASTSSIGIVAGVAFIALTATSAYCLFQLHRSIR